MRMNALDTQETERFLHEWFGDPTGYIEIRLIDNEGHVKPAFYASLEDLTTTLKSTPIEQYHIFFGAAPRAEERGTKDSITNVPGFWADLDVGQNGHKKACVYATKEEALETLAGFPLRPTIIVDSGNGLHCYWKLKEPLVFEDPYQVEATNRALANTLNADTACDVCRLLRLPGTLNIKDAQNPKSVTVISCDPTCCYNPSDFHFLPIEEVTDAQGTDVVFSEKPTSEVDPSRVSPRIMQLIKDGNAQGKYRSRSEADQAIVNELVKKGYSDDEILSIYSDPDNECGEKMRKKGGAGKSYLALTIKKARQQEKSGSNAPTKHDETCAADIADAFLAHRHYIEGGELRLRVWHGEWFKWDGRRYVTLPEGDLRADIMDYLRGDRETRHKAGPTLTKNVVANLEALCLIPAIVEQPAWLGDDGLTSTRNLVPMANGILDIEPVLKGDGRAELRPHSPKLFSAVCLPYDYDPDADCPRWSKFLSEVQPDPESRNLLQEWCGYLLTPDTTLHRFLVLEGEGSNGKSAFCNVVAAVLGFENISSVPLELFGATHSVVETLGKLANIAPEVGELGRTSEGILKSYIAGDPISFNPKYRPTFTARPTARLMLATNTMPRFADRTQGIWRRMLLVPFPVTIPEEKQNPNLASELAEERSGILNWALHGLWRLRRKGRFTEPEVCREAKEDYRRQSNPVRLFLVEHCQEDPHAETPTVELYKAYVAFCGENGYQSQNEVNFGKEVRRVFPKVGRKERRQEGRRWYVYQGIGSLGRQ